MKNKQALFFGLSLVASCFSFEIRQVFAQAPESRMFRIAELEIYPHQVDAFKAALKEEIAASMGREPGVLALYAVSLKGSQAGMTLV